MSQAVVGGNVLEGDIVGDDELLQAGSDSFAKNQIGFQPQGIGGGGDAGIGLQFSLGGDDGGAHGLSRLELP